MRSTASYDVSTTSYDAIPLDTREVIADVELMQDDRLKLLEFESMLGPLEDKTNKSRPETCLCLAATHNIHFQET